MASTTIPIFSPSAAIIVYDARYSGLDSYVPECVGKPEERTGDHRFARNSIIPCSGLPSAYVQELAG